MRRFIRRFLVPFLLLAIPMGILAGLGFIAAHRQLERTRTAAVARTVDAVTALVADYQDSLRRETVLLARDPVVIEGTAKGDWAILARGASPEEVKELGLMARALRECVGGCTKNQDGKLSIMLESCTPRVSRWPLVTVAPSPTTTSPRTSP